MTMLSALGWVATAIFSSSYFFRRPAALRWIQAIAAVVWIAYGCLIHAVPVVVANAIVAIAAIYSSLFTGSLPTGSLPTGSSPRQAQLRENSSSLRDHAR